LATYAAHPDGCATVLQVFRVLATSRGSRISAEPPAISVGRPSSIIRIHQSFLVSVSNTNGPTPKAEVATPVRFAA
jgi:hypothetical protein